MIRLVLLFVVLGLGLYVGTQFSGQQGYVLISVAQKTIEMSVTTLVVLIVAMLALLFFLEYLLKKIVRTGSSTLNWFTVRKVRRARQMTNEGIIELLEGNWKGAEKKVTKFVAQHDMPLLCYLIASEAAQGQGDRQKRDHYLALAGQQEHAFLAVELTRAKQLVRDGEHTAALSTLEAIKQAHPDNQVALSLLRTTYQQLGLWQPLLDMLPRLVKLHLITEHEQAELAEQAQCGLLSDVATQQGSEGLVQHWNHLNRKAKHSPHLIACFAKQLIARGADSHALTVLKEALKKHPTPELFALLPELNLPDMHPVVSLLESMVAKSPAEAAAHSALAQLYFRQENWLEAQRQFEQALTMRSDVSDYAYLADTLEKQNLNKAAHEVSRKALTLVQKPH